MIQLYTYLEYLYCIDNKKRNAFHLQGVFLLWKNILTKAGGHSVSKGSFYAQTYEQLHEIIKMMRGRDGLLKDCKSSIF